MDFMKITILPCVVLRMIFCRETKSVLCMTYDVLWEVTVQFYFLASFIGLTVAQKHYRILSDGNCTKGKKETIPLSRLASLRVYCVEEIFFRFAITIMKTINFDRTYIIFRIIHIGCLLSRGLNSIIESYLFQFCIGPRNIHVNVSN